MARRRGRPTKLDENKIEKIRALRSQMKSYSAIADDIGVSKRLLLYWSARGRSLQSGLHREVYLALRRRRRSDIASAFSADSPRRLRERQH